MYPDKDPNYNKTSFNWYSHASATLKFLSNTLLDKKITIVNSRSSHQYQPGINSVTFPSLETKLQELRHGSDVIEGLMKARYAWKKFMEENNDTVYKKVVADVGNDDSNFCAADLVAAMVMFYPKIVKNSETLEYKLRTLAPSEGSIYYQMHAFVLGSNVGVPADFDKTTYKNRFVQRIHDVSISTGIKSDEDALPAKVRHNSYFMGEKEVSQIFKGKILELLGEYAVATNDGSATQEKCEKSSETCFARVKKQFLSIRGKQ